MFNFKRCFKISFMGLLFAISFLFITAFINLPSDIVLVKGSEKFFKSFLPIEAVIQPSTTAISIDNQPIEDNIEINLNNGFCLKADDEGIANMTLNAFGIPFKEVSINIVPDVEIVPCGMTIGVKINTDGVMVLGTGTVYTHDGTQQNPCDNLLKSGDLILSANGQKLNNKQDLINFVENNSGNINFEVKRNEKIESVEITPVISKDDGKNKIGLWVRDNTQGIGTLTYYNPETNKFGALGHGITDVDTKQIMNIKSGIITDSKVTSIVKGESGNPGELIGDINESEKLGEVELNSHLGIYGEMDLTSIVNLPKEKMKIGLRDEIHEGPATIRTNIDGNFKDYDIYIENINRFSTDDSKGMVIKVTDPDLLEMTNGIVQGMSGSPIIQDGKLVGAVTHVFVHDSTKGYGIFIENMLNVIG